MSSLKVYVAAASYRQREARNVYRRLARHGLEVTGTWVFKRSLGEVDTFPTEAARDLIQIQEADLVLTLTENPRARRPKYTTGGRHVECGYALGKGKPLVVVGPKENVFHYLPNVVQFDIIEDAVVYLEDLNKELYGGEDKADQDS